MTEGATWRSLLDEAAAELDDRTEARRIVEQASGYFGAELVTALDNRATTRTLTHFESMVRRCGRLAASHSISAGGTSTASWSSLKGRCARR